MTTFIEALEAELPGWLLNDFEDDGETGGGFVGCVFGIVGDICAHYLTFASRGFLLRDSSVAEDSLMASAWERGMPRYEGESSAQHASRMANAWTAYAYAGRVAIAHQLSHYGFGDDVEIYDAAQWPTEYPVGPQSQFWVIVPAGDHPFEPLLVGSFSFGPTTYVGISGCTQKQMSGIRALIRKWKPVQWVCREIRFMVDSGLHATIAVQPP